MNILPQLPTLATARRDVPAGIVVFLVALPLCLGIALASGAPLLAGVVAGIVGGLVVTLFSGSELSVSGPAAGLATVVLGAIAQLGSFEVFLCAVVLAGVAQAAAAFLRAGAMATMIPHSVIKGMLAAIGITIIGKQLPHVLGHAPAFMDASQVMDPAAWIALVRDPATALGHVHGGAVLVAVVSVAVMVVWTTSPVRRRRWSGLVPPALVAVVIGALLNRWFATAAPAFYLSADRDQLVHLPVLATIDDVLQQLHGPDWAGLLQPVVWLTALKIFTVASVESLLSVEAVDKIDPEHRIADPDRELFAQGIGNMLSGLLGGLPVTSVIVRSSAGIYAGAASRLTSVVHGALILGSVALLPSVLNQIPYASLAAILLVVGYNLTSVGTVRSVIREGRAQLIPFAVTVVGVVWTDIIVGVAAGVLTSLVWVIRANRRAGVTVVHDGGTVLLRFNKDLSFLHKHELNQALRAIPDGHHVIIDGTMAGFVDHDIYESLATFDHGAERRGITIDYRNVHHKEHR